MIFFNIFLALLLSISAYAEIPLGQLKGLDSKMKFGAERFSPVYGFLALKTGTLERIRFFGNYGKIYDDQKQFLLPNFSEHLEWQHPAFEIKKTETLSEEDAAEETARNFGRQFEHPLDSISSLIQWLFPSPDGVNFIPNTRDKDPVGDISKGVKQILELKDLIKRLDEEKITLSREKDEIQQRKEEFREKDEILKEKTKQTPKAINSMAILKNVSKGKEPRTIEEINKITEKVKQSLKERNIDAEIEALKELSEKYPGQFKEIDDQIKALNASKSQEKDTEKDALTKEIASLRSNINILESKSSEKERSIKNLEKSINNIKLLSYILKTIYENIGKQITLDVFEELAVSYPQQKEFIEILYHALVQDGTFGRNHDPLYPKHITIHALLGYLWSVLDNQTQFIEILKEAELLEPAASNDLTEYEDPQKTYQGIKRKIKTRQQVSFEEAAFAGYGYEIYESPYPPKIYYGDALAPKTESIREHVYPDCGETAIRNLFNVFISSAGGNFHPEYLDKFGTSEKIAAIKKFYTDFPTISSHQGQNARNAWSNIVTYLNGPQNPNKSSNTDVQYSKNPKIQIRVSDINSGEWGIGNILNVIAKLTADSTLSQTWIVSPNSTDFKIRKQEFYDQISQKLDHLCTMFSRGEEFKLDWSIDEGKKLSSPIGNFKFTIKTPENTEPDVFEFIVEQGHFDFEPQYAPENDWRKAKRNQLTPTKEVLLDLSNKPLLHPFYKAADKLSPFLNPSIKEYSSRMINDWIRTKTPQEIAKITLPLRLLYKLYRNPRGNENAYRKILVGLGIMFNPEKRGKTKITDIDFGDKRDKLTADFLRTLNYNPQLVYRAINDDLFDTQENSVFMEFLVKNQIDINHPNKKGLTPLHMAVLKMDKPLITKLINEHADINLADEDGKTPLHHAVENSNSKIVELLIEKEANITLTDNNGKTPLHLAAQKGKMKITKMLLAKDKSNINQTDNNGRTPLSYIEKKIAETSFVNLKMKSKFIRIKNIFLANGATQTETLHFAARYGQLDVIKRLLLANTNAINNKDENNLSPLHIAAKYGHFEIVRFLIKHKAIINIKGGTNEEQKRMTPLHFAAKYGYYKIVKFLVQNKADVNPVSKDGKTPLDLSLEADSIDIVSFLIDNEGKKHTELSIP